MGKIVLFSPIGGTDPMSMNNCHDGSLLHICRVYKPDIVYLYMSKEILGYHKRDNRYIFFLDALADRIAHKMEYHIIERPDLTDVQKFDILYADIRNEVQGISQKLEEDDTLLLNVSSGTPAMKSALLVMNVLGEYPFKAIQVDTPLKKMNEHNHKDFEEMMELLWEENEDNRDDFVNRCTEVDCPALLVMKRNEILKKHIGEYDYAGAIDTLSMTMDSKIKKYLELAYYRNILDFRKVELLEKELSVEVLPIRSGDVKKYYEYMLTLIVRQKKKMYADFLRAITPLLVDLFQIILKKQCNIDINNYVREDRKTGGKRWDRNKMEESAEGRDIMRILVEEYGEVSYSFVGSDSISKIITYKSNDSKLSDLVRSLREVESRIRNMAAHQIISIDDEKIKKETGFSSSRIMQMIIEAFDYTGFNIKREMWDSYDLMNEILIQKI